MKSDLKNQILIWEKLVKESSIYQDWRNITKNIFFGEIKPNVDQIVELLSSSGIKLRETGNTLIGSNFFYSDLSDFSKDNDKPLIIGFVYKKPNGDKTQDFRVIYPDGDIVYCRNNKELSKINPALKGMHKKYFSIVSFTSPNPQ